MNEMRLKAPNIRIKSDVKVTVIYQEGDEFINENQQYQNGTNADESETDSPTA